MQNVPEYSRVFQNVPEFMQVHELACSYISLHAVIRACMQFLSLSEQLTRISQCLFSIDILYFNIFLLKESNTVSSADQQKLTVPLVSIEDCKQRYLDFGANLTLR